MKIVFASDIHGNLGAFQAFQKQLSNEKPDHVFFCGDVFGYYYNQNEILTILRESGWKCLLGNHDQYFIDMINGLRDTKTLCEKYGSTYKACLKKGAIEKKNLAFLRKLKPCVSATFDGLRIGVFHGSPNDPLEGRIYPNTPITNEEDYAKWDIVVCGHTHHKMLRHIGSTLLVNPGSLGQQRDGKGCSFAVLDTKNLAVRFQLIDYDIEDLLSKIEQNDPQNFRLSGVLTRHC